MKLIIEIPKEKYNDILHTHVNMRSIVDNAVAMGTPIPDNATVCDIEQIKAEIEQERDKVYQNRKGHDTYYADGLDTALDIIDHYTK